MVRECAQPKKNIYGQVSIKYKYNKYLYVSGFILSLIYKVVQKTTPILNIDFS